MDFRQFAKRAGTAYFIAQTDGKSCTKLCRFVANSPGHASGTPACCRKVGQNEMQMRNMGVEAKYFRYHRGTGSVIENPTVAVNDIRMTDLPEGGNLGYNSAV